jgi:hypothetical protein
MLRGVEQRAGSTLNAQQQHQQLQQQGYERVFGDTAAMGTVFAHCGARFVSLTCPVGS